MYELVFQHLVSIFRSSICLLQSAEIYTEGFKLFNHCIAGGAADLLLAENENRGADDTVAAPLW